MVLICPFLITIQIPSDDYNRVVLDTLPGMADTDYINASYIDVSGLEAMANERELIKN